MGLGLKSFEETFSFVKKNPKIFLLALLPAIPALPMSFMISNLNPIWIVANLFYLIGAIIVYLIVGFILSIVAMGAFPIVVYQSRMKKEIKLGEALKSSLKKFGKILLTLIILAGISIAIISIPLLVFILSIFFSSTILLVLSLILLIPFVVILVFFSLRLSIAIPILILENKSLMESIKKSWNMTKGQIWSILGGSLLLALVVMVISLPINFLGIVLEILHVPYVSNITNLITSTISLAFSGPFITIVYFNIKKGSEEE
ncbi:MAG: glycerophosphoryl diester phosphodiesterase membrane domain-containing protein [Candidatus Aenigmatarchaeota archaeon]